MQIHVARNRQQLGQFSVEEVTSVSEREKAQEKLIMENRQALSDTKAKWVAQTRVALGAQVTVTGLAPYLDGKEIKSIVGRTTRSQ